MSEIVTSKLLDSQPTGTSGQAIYPPNELIDRYLDFARDMCESEDNLLIGALLPVCGAMLGRNVWFDFGRKLYPNIYSILAAPAGFRKSTCVNLAESIAARILNKDRFLSGQASEEALFYEYDPENGGCADKILIEDEGNTILTNWSNSQYGKTVSKRFLSLYDCKSWKQAFKQNLKDGDSVVKSIEESSTNLLIAATLGPAGFGGLEAKDGMQRRFLTYLSENLVRTIYLPKSQESQEFENLLLDLSLLPNLEGKISFSDSAFELWKEIQDRNRAEISECKFQTSKGSQSKASLLANEPTCSLKIGMIFTAFRIILRENYFSKNQDSFEMEAEELLYANAHVRQCIQDSMALEKVSQKAEIREDSERIYYNILGNPKGLKSTERKDGTFIVLTKTQLTSRFANDSRRGGMTIERLYNEIIPDLKRQRKCIELEQVGKKRTFGFLKEDDHP
ncbi:hypothetical protein [Pelagicoccus mobilis]|uniref:DUF3987 domain-containing protein n=1 Tax=Pelagicoccus mobilis TaxID=415221 RepID=A0A934S0N6_9BACT|nr:hypothetical protein [Pelagicoccus mobilis]MBK1880202.1 hypothetical protein [Pelagicoccus mobilis]